MVPRSEEVGRQSALLYAANTAGALAGAVVTGYYLVSGLGISRSFLVAAACNLLAGVAALLVAGRNPSGGAEGPAPRPGRPLTRSTRLTVLGVFGLSGFVALALEIVWFRALLAFLPATTYVFTTILAVVLGGIAAGSAIVKPLLARDRDWVGVLALVELAIPFAAIGSLAAQSWTYAAGWKTAAVLQGSALAILPTMLLMGAAFPIGLHCWNATIDAGRVRTGARIGVFYLVNLFGSIVGAIAAGFWLVPALGARGAILAVSLASVCGGLLLLSLTRGRRLARLAVATVALVAFTALAFTLPDPLDAVLARRYPGERVLWRHEGVQSTVTVQARNGLRVLYLDGLHQANDSRPMVALHRKIGAMALLLHPRPERALVIGLGGGVTPGAVSLFRRARIEVVELSPGVVAGSEWFRHVNNDLLRQPHVRLRIDDGRNHLLLAGERYDVITADIIQPFHAGAGNLYSREYFQLAARALEADGLMLQWIGHRPASQYRLIARTFQSVFPHATVWAQGTLLVGTRGPLRLSRAAYTQRLADPQISIRRSPGPGFPGSKGWSQTTRRAPTNCAPLWAMARCSPTTVLSSSTSDRCRAASLTWTSAACADRSAGTSSRSPGAVSG